MPNRLSKLSQRRLRGVKPSLVMVVERAIQISEQDFMVLEGVRDEAKQKKLYAQGRTMPGKIVTWTLQSRHFRNKADGYGHAVDLVPYPIDWNTPAKFDAIAKAMFAAANELKVKIRWGANWDNDGNFREKGESDSPHFELVN